MKKLLFSILLLISTQQTSAIVIETSTILASLACKVGIAAAVYIGARLSQPQNIDKAKQIIEIVKK